jgi:hypothetical protein
VEVKNSLAFYVMELFVVIKNFIVQALGVRLLSSLCLKETLNVPGQSVLLFLFQELNLPSPKCQNYVKNLIISSKSFVLNFQAEIRLNVSIAWIFENF